MTHFQSTDRGATKVFDDKGLVLQFQRLNNNLAEDQSGNKIRLKRSDDWVCATDDEKVIKRAKAHKDFSEEPNVEGKFWIVDKTPVNPNKVSIAKAGTLTSKESKEENK
jgi:hypothetical protein